MWCVVLLLHHAQIPQNHATWVSVCADVVCHSPPLDAHYYLTPHSPTAHRHSQEFGPGGLVIEARRAEKRGPKGRKGWGSWGGDINRSL